MIKSRRTKLFATSILILFSFTKTIAEQTPVPTITIPSEILSDDGHVTIQWSLPVAASMVEVQQARDRNFIQAKIIYTGPDNATFISGLPDGTYFYRVRKLQGEWSDTVTVTVRHHNLTMAFVLFGLGAIVFLLTVFIVVRGTRTATLD